MCWRSEISRLSLQCRLVGGSIPEPLNQKQSTLRYGGWPRHAAFTRFCCGCTGGLFRFADPVQGGAHSEAPSATGGRLDVGLRSVLAVCLHPFGGEPRRCPEPRAAQGPEESQVTGQGTNT